MKATTYKPQSGSEKSEVRKQHLLDAATECFRQHGIQGSSIAMICQTAGMSPGHVYYYFRSKEAIVEAIAVRDENDTAELMDQLEQGSTDDLVTRLTRLIPAVVQRNSDPAYAGLVIALTAEAVRNPMVAEILRRSDEALHTRFLKIADRVGGPANMDPATLRLRIGMIATIFTGLVFRSILEPRRDQAAIVQLVNEQVRLLLGGQP
ncbi:TetR/AcrR family transcriptional regulator [Salmonella enterica subsp. enterica serovar Typhimurium]|nr:MULTISPECIES: TetR/AcrR family transcriptional regulator [Enterobacteriaceae]EBI0102584.1 TetR/AcrR family transcriptional regulator [Salmonella enterica subsp. enterica serovar Johannesburg]ECB6493476.1 TetR/AcrR family transcriptional regulator [Salmonella enterica subsp. enterica serovar Typhimurium]ECC4320536.1 TetR/AcrR family transcriptional regulator [Salmonella enterica]EKS9206010.1 TetR/AcrR family transcriptional regulator [Enterobacter cloacae]NGF63322.1 TetR/AcrR family transcri